ncbi:MAG: hypothetical protein HY647_00540 [Acidobacteria bacterium]|nr:hypothetical protein [Acidobacteriota bacterium]
MMIIAAIIAFGMVGAAQSPPPFAISSIPTGLRPLGMDIAFPSGLVTSYVVVANSGDNSVSFLRAGAGGGTTAGSGYIVIVPELKVAEIPSPYAVATCPRVPDQFNQLDPISFRVLVSSPSDNSVHVVGMPPTHGGITVLGTLQVGPQPHSIACFEGPGRKVWGAVSNVGDNSLTVFDVDTLTVIARIPNMPASRGFHGIRGIRTSGVTTAAGRVVVAGTDANVVTTVSLDTFRILNQTPVARPTAITEFGNIYVASSGSNEIFEYNPFDTGLTSRYKNVPSPEDVVGSELGFFATIGGQDSLSFWRQDEFDTPRSVIPEIPSPRALAVIALEHCLDARPSISPCARPERVSAVLVTSTSSNSLFFIQLNHPPLPAVPANFPVHNGADFASGQAAPGALASASVATGVSEAFNASLFGEPLPKTLAGVTLKIGGSLSFDTPSNQWVYSSTGAVDAPLHFVGPNQINFQVPTGISLGDSVPAQLTKPDGSTLLTTFRIVPTAPGIFTVLMNGQGQAAALNQDNSQNGNPQSILGAKPAARGSVIQIFATGAGETDPPLLPGEPAPANGDPLVFTRVQPTVTIGGQTARVLFSGMAPGWVGLWQINAEVPQNVTPGPAVPLTLTAGGTLSNTVNIAVE